MTDSYNNDIFLEQPLALPGPLKVIISFVGRKKLRKGKGYLLNQFIRGTLGKSKTALANFSALNEPT